MTLRRLTAAFCAVAIVLAQAPVAIASGPDGERPWYLDQYGGGPADTKALWSGRLGVMMATAPRPILYIEWRLLHGQRVGQQAGDALSTPCCDSGFLAHDYSGGQSPWQEARKAIVGDRSYSWVNTERPGPNDTSQQNCFDEAFDRATATLKDRAARYGAKSPAVRAWLDGQDAVFKACHDDVTMPPLPADAPAWLKADRAYQEAAQALYEGRNDEASARFEAISRDAASPWRGLGFYLSVRALTHEALARPTPQAWTRARAAVERLAAAPAGTFGQSQAHPLRGVLDFHEHPEAYFARMVRELATPDAAIDIASSFRDFTELGDARTPKPEILDWMATLQAAPPPEPPTTHSYPERVMAALPRQAAAKSAAFAHAEAMWKTGHDIAWLVAALSLADPDRAETPALRAEALSVPGGSPAWLTAQYHALRLSLGREPAAHSRLRLDAILKRRDLTASDRGVFEALRAQTAAGLDDFARHATRRRLCAQEDLAIYDEGAVNPPPCVRDRWDNGSVQPSGVYDGVGRKGAVGFGEDARAVIDRMPLATRIALGESSRLPPRLRLDVALTSFGRAVALQDDAAADRLASQLAVLLPLMAAEFHAVPTAAPGPDKRFAEFYVLAKIPGVRTDLDGFYVRPEGRSVAAFQSHWADWAILPRSAAAAPRPTLPLAAYQQGGTGTLMDYFPNEGRYDPRGTTPDGQTDLSCLGECGRGAAPLRLPDFVAAGQRRTAQERSRFIAYEDGYSGKPSPFPKGAVSPWDEMLTYIAAHPGDPRAPEALHWLVHVGHFGGSHNRSGYRAFRLLHARYAASYWAKKTPYYND